MPIFQGLSLCLQPTHHSSRHYQHPHNSLLHTFYPFPNSMFATTVQGTVQGFHSSTGLCQLLHNFHNPAMMKKKSSTLMLPHLPPQHQQPPQTQQSRQQWPPLCHPSTRSILSSLGFLVSKLLKPPRWSLFANLRKRQAARSGPTIGNHPPVLTVLLGLTAMNNMGVNKLTKMWTDVTISIGGETSP